MDKPAPPPCQVVQRGYLPGWSFWLLAPLIVIDLIVFFCGLALLPS